MITNDARCTREIKSRVAMIKSTFNKEKIILTSELDLNLRKKPQKFCIWIITLYGAETWTFWKIYQKYLESFRMWCWRIMVDQLDGPCNK
jgi:hypothetical protein